MRLTAKELEQMKSVDIGAVAPESLPDVSGMAFDTSLTREERIALFLQAVENPYCFCIGRYFRGYKIGRSASYYW